MCGFIIPRGSPAGMNQPEMRGVTIRVMGLDAG
jgi:hypothetical protein